MYIIATRDAKYKLHITSIIIINIKKILIIIIIFN